MNVAIRRILNFCLDRMADEPPLKRAQMYRDFAEVFPSESVCGQLRALAEDIETNERRHRQLLLDFQANHLSRHE